MQTCYNCGTEVSDQTLICPECGALVKRYTQAPSREAFYPDEAPQTEPATAQPPQPYEDVFASRQAKPAAKTGGLTFWLVLCLVASGYLALTYGCMLLVYYNQELYAEIFNAMPEFAEFAEMLQQLVVIIGEFLWAYTLLLVLSAIHAGCTVWLLASRRRPAFWFYVASGTVLGLLMVFFTSPGYAMLCLAGTGITIFLTKAGRVLGK